MSRPLRSIPFPYSSTATPTMLESRFAGPSWAPSDGVAPRPVNAVNAAITTRNLIPNEIIGDPRRTLVVPPHGVGGPSRLENDHRAGSRRTVRQRHPDRRHAELPCPIGGSTMQSERWPVVTSHDLDLPPPNAASQRVP